MNRPVTAPTPVDYPCSDGQPMAESDFQLEPLLYAITALRTHFHHRKKVYVAGDMFLYVSGGVKPRINGEQHAPGTTRCSAGRQWVTSRQAATRLLRCAPALQVTRRNPLT